MPDRFDFGGVHLNAGESPEGARPSPDTPFAMAILGDFSGRASRGLSDQKTVGERRAILIDRDNFEEVFAGLNVRLHLATAEGAPVVLEFSALEDFHPEHLFEHPAFGRLRELRGRLENPSTFARAAEELGVESRPSPGSPARKIDDSEGAAPSPVRLAGGSLLDDMIDETEARGAVEPAARKRDEVREFAQQLAARYRVPSPDPRQPEFIAAVDRAVEDVMRKILHSPDFQALEAIWRATFLLVRQLETGPRLKLYLFDISKAELAADVTSSADPGSSGVFRLLVEKAGMTPGADPWALVVGDYSFGPDQDDTNLLSGMAEIARRAGAPFLAGASPSLLGVASLAGRASPRDWTRPQASGWAELRRLPEAEFIGLALPRFLLRLPYGERTSPVEGFDFEEFEDPLAHEHYLWANAAFAVALLLAESFSQAGWQMRPGLVAQLDRLPLHVYKRDGESVSKPCAEVLVTEDALAYMLEQGMIPLVCYKGRDSARIARFQSIAQPARTLAGRWCG
jgi:type VI secretion system protein ImpC